MYIKNELVMPNRSNMGIKSYTMSIITIFSFCNSVDINYYSNKDPVDNETDKFEKNPSMGHEVLDAAAKNLTSYARTAFNNRSMNWTTKSRHKYDYHENLVKVAHIFDDYEYEYADDGDPTIDSSTISNAIVDIVEFPAVNTSLKPDADIFNLEPAIKTVTINTPSRVSKRVWFVPEEYPCWRLPLLYGRLKHKVKPDVFILKGPELYEIQYEEKVNENDNVTPRRHPVFDYCSRWCDQGPCYGDHTLCVFPGDKISRICGTGYIVKKLTVNEQNAVTNAVNKIRSTVALGLVGSLPPATNMQLIQYDTDLAMISRRWLQQCLPGPASCSSLNNNLVTQLECKKSTRQCCLNKRDRNCVPSEECFVSPIVGCVHAWFLSGINAIQVRNIRCAYITEHTYNTVQILWAKTSKMGCAYGESANGDIRVICNFSPGARFYITTNFYCGLIPHKDITQKYDAYIPPDITYFDFTYALGMHLKKIDLALEYWRRDMPSTVNSMSSLPWSVDVMHQKLGEDTLRKFQDIYVNGTIGAVARLVAKYTFFEESKVKCDSRETIYDIGPSGSDCDGTSRVFTGLCYMYRTPYPFYRLIAIVAPVALFSLILYDLFNGVIRQTNY